MNFNDLDKINSHIHRVEKIGDLNWLKVFRENCSTNIYNTEAPGYDAENEWLSEFISPIIDNVDFIISSPTALIYSLEKTNQGYDLNSEAISVDNKDFENINDFCNFIKSFKYKGILLYTIQRFVKFDIHDNTCQCKYRVRYKEFEDVARYRGVKLNEIIE